MAARADEHIRAKCFHPSGTFIEYPKEDVETSIPERFEKIVWMYPDGLAVKTKDQSVTYDELNRAANRVAREIIECRGTDAESVGLLFEKGVPLIAAVLGVLKAGKYFVLLDPSFPIARVAAILRDSRCALVLSQQETKSLAAAISSACELMKFESISSSTSTENLQLPLAPTMLASILYTSGSTGQPKGVVWAHRNLLHQAMVFTNAYHFCGHDRFTLLASATGNAVTNIFCVLLNGGVLLPFETRKEGVARLRRWMVKEQISVGWMGSPLFRNLCETLTGEETFPSLRLIRLTSESVYKSDVDLYKKHFAPNCVLTNGLSSTETGLLRTYLIDHDTEITGIDVPVGYPVEDKEILLLDETGKEVGFNHVGEIVVKSPYLSLGYWQKPDLTKVKFQPDQRDGQGPLYRTGDLGLMLPDGSLVHKGRKDFRVKIRGYGVELSEIEGALLGHPQIREAAVVAWDRGSGEKYVAAYVIAQHGEALTTSTLRGFLSPKLPDYMLPSTFVFLESLPLVYGKVDRKALPKPDDKRPELSMPYAAPRNELEETLAQIWEEVLDIRPIGIHDNFFDLGGHSLLATRIVSRVIEQFELEIPLQSVFHSPTIADVAAVITEQQQRKGRGEDVGIDETAAFSFRRIPKDRMLPLSFAQQRLWFLNQLEPDSPVYNEPKALRFRGRLQGEALQKALDMIVERHEVLRTTFVSIDGKPRQVIHEPGSLELTPMELYGLPVTQREEELHRLLSELSQRPFDLEKNWPLRAALIRLAEDENVLLLVTHHIASDGWSSNILYRELSALYEAFSHGKASPLKELPIQYADYAVWQKAWLQGEVLEKQLSYWKKRLEGVNPLQLPTDRPRPSVQEYKGKTETFTLPKEIAEGLKDLSRQQHVTLFMTLLAAFQTLLHNYTGQDDIVVGSPTAGRNRVELEGQIGFFINTLVLRSNFAGDPTFRELLASVREMALGAYAHQDLPFEKLVEELQPERSLSHNPLFQVMFQLRNYPKDSVELPALTIEEFEFDTGVAKFDLSMGLRDEVSGLKGSIEYRTDLFDNSTMIRMIDCFQVLLESIATNPEQRISNLPILTAAEKHQILVEWNDTGKDYPGDKCLHQLFEQQVETTPDAIAAIFPSAGSGHGEDQQFTYGELNRRANQLAHYLQNLGVGPEVLVAICMERSLDMIVGLLGILKAGGAYVPLDPAYPEERLAFMLEDSQATVLLTQQRLAADLPIQNPKSKIENPVVVCLDTGWECIARESEKNPASDVRAGNLAYLIYTSGSTGRPKGVAMSHGSLCHLIVWQLEHFSYPNPAKTLQFAPLSFDVSFQEIFTTWCSGGALLLIAEELRRDGRDLLRYLRDKAAERLLLPFVALQQLAEVAEEKAVVPAHLREIITAGEQLQIGPHITGFFRKLNGCRLHNQYGPSETHVVTAFTLRDSPDNWPALPPIGQPIANTQIYLLDIQLQPVPIGVAGELHIGGAGLARGYLNRPELTAEKFIPNPFSDEPGARLYKTGDLARHLPDGNIEFLGRIDHQVKIRGFRVELGEIEAVLGQHAAVEQVVVTVREDSPGNKRLVAYVVSKQKPSLPVSELRSFLKEKLPDYMAPSAFVFLDALPLTPSGKVDRRGLPDPDSVRPDLQDGYVAPRGSIEKLVAETWADILHLDKVGIHDNFFDLGGHSLLATQLVSRIRDALRIELPLRTLFECPTVAEMGKVITEHHGKMLGEQEMEKIVTELESLSDEEAHKRLSESSTLVGKNK